MYLAVLLPSIFALYALYKKKLTNLAVLCAWVMGVVIAYCGGLFPFFALALTFVSLITDTQWDTTDAMVVAANIDISKNEFNYIEHINNAYKLTSILIGTSLIMFGILYWFYELDLGITILYFSFEIIYFLLYPMYRIKICYLQLEYSAWKTTTNKIIASILRIGISLMDSPFCTGIGQVCSSVYQFVSVNAMFYLNYKINKKGIIVKKRKKCI